MTGAQYEMTVGGPGNDKLTEKTEVILFCPTDKQMVELDKLIEQKVALRVNAEAAKLGASIVAWIKQQDIANALIVKKNRADNIAQKKHMRVVETYLKGFNKLLGRKK